MLQARSNVKSKVGLRNVRIKPKAFNRGSQENHVFGQSSNKKNPMFSRQESTVIRSISTGDTGDDALADTSMADVSMMSLNDDSQMMGVNNAGNTSGFSDSSAGGVQKIRGDISDGGSMYSGTGDDVQVKRGGNDVSQDMNNSMAGLSDMSMGDI